MWMTSLFSGGSWLCEVIYSVNHSMAVSRSKNCRMLAPDTHQYNTIRELLSLWIEQYGPGEAFEEVEKSAKFLKTWWKVL